MKFALIMIIVSALQIIFWEISSYIVTGQISLHKIKIQDFILLLNRFISYFVGAKIFKSFGLKCLQEKNDKNN